METAFSPSAPPPVPAADVERRSPVRRRSLVVFRRLAASAFALFSLFIAGGQTASAQPDRYAAFVADAADGRTLFARNADALRHPASLTKIMTLYLAFDDLAADRLTLDERILVSKRAARQPRSKLGLKAGSSLSVEDAILALIVRSANDAATALAEHLGTTEGRFAQRMTRRAHELGMKNTVFRNASGLHHKQQKTTARDIAIMIAGLIAEHPRYYRFFSTRFFSYKGRTYRNGNRLLGAVAGVDGVKTGFINASGYNLAVSRRVGDSRLIAVVMGGDTAALRNRHMRDILDAVARGRPVDARSAARPANSRPTRKRPGRRGKTAAKTAPPKEPRHVLAPPPPPRTWNGTRPTLNRPPPQARKHLVTSVVRTSNGGVLYRLNPAPQKGDERNAASARDLCTTSRQGRHVSCFIRDVGDSATPSAP